MPVFPTDAGQVDAPSQEAANLWAAKQKAASAASKPSAPAEKPDTSSLGALFRGFLHGAEMTGRGVVQLGERMPNILPGATAGRQKLLADTQQGIKQSEQAYQGAPGTQAHPILSGIGRFGGEMAATAPLAAAGPLVRAAGLARGLAPMASTMATRIGSNVLRGAAGAAAAPVTGGDYWTEKGKQLLMGGAIGGAVPAVGGAMAGALPSIPQFAANVGRAFPSLRAMLTGSEGRTIDGFNRIVIQQALEPIGGDVPRNIKAGYGLMDYARRQLGDAYDKIKPRLSLKLNTGPAAWQTFQPQVDKLAGELPGDLEKTFRNIIKNRVESRFDVNGIMDGQAFKDAESELSGLSYTYMGTNNDALGQALRQANGVFRDALMQQNPADAPTLKRINDAWRMFATVSSAASKKSGEGRFSPSDLSGALEKQSSDISYASGRAASGGGLPDGVLQAYADLGRKQLAGATIGPLDLWHALSPKGIANAALRYGPRPAGRAMTSVAPAVTPTLGMTTSEAERSSKRYQAARRGDLNEVQRLDLSR